MKIQSASEMLSSENLLGSKNQKVKELTFGVIVERSRYKMYKPYAFHNSDWRRRAVTSTRSSKQPGHLMRRTV